MPAFSFRQIKNLYPVFWGKSVEMAEAIAHEINVTGTSHVEVNGWASRSTLDIIGLAGSRSPVPALRAMSNPVT